MHGFEYFTKVTIKPISAFFVAIPLETEIIVLGPFLSPTAFALAFWEGFEHVWLVVCVSILYAVVKGVPSFLVASSLLAAHPPRVILCSHQQHVLRRLKAPISPTCDNKVP